MRGPSLRPLIFLSYSNLNAYLICFCAFIEPLSNYVLAAVGASSAKDTLSFRISAQGVS